MGSASFPKKEHLCSTRLIEELFGSGSQSVVAYPIRAVFRKTNRSQTGIPVQVIVTVSKKHFKHAVDRNRVKRQVREAYRRTKQSLCKTIDKDESLLVGFVWISNELTSSAKVANRIDQLVRRISEKL